MTSRLGTASPHIRSALRAPERIEGGPLLVLRAFLGVTFAFAGLQKLANPNFFRSNAPGSFKQQVLGAIVTSPLHHLLSPAVHAPVLVAIVISFGELAVGIGTLLGLCSRVAALGGMVLALLFFLSVSFNDAPYYYGPDIVFLFAWTPLVLSSPGRLTLDAWLEQRRVEDTARLSSRRASRVALDEGVLDRRAFLRRATAFGVVAAATLGLGGGVSALGRRGSKSTTGASAPLLKTETTPPTKTTSPAASSSSNEQAPKGTEIGLASEVPAGGAASFTDPQQGIPAYVVQPTSGKFVAFSAVCTHAGCTVNFDESQEAFVCPCHGSVFSATTGQVEQGPAPSPLTSIAVALGPGGTLYVEN